MKPIDVKEIISDNKLAEFTHHSVFGALPVEEIQWLLENGELSQLDSGETLFMHDDRGDSFYIILEGTLEYYKYHDGVYAYIRNYTQGQQIGFVSMIALHDRVGKAIASEQSLILNISSDLFHEFHLHAPLPFGILMMNLSREMARTFRDVNNLIVELTKANQSKK